MKQNEFTRMRVSTCFLSASLSPEYPQMSLRACACQHARRRGLCLILLITVACLALLFPGCRSSKPDPFAGLVIKESKTGQYDEIKVAPGFLLLSNMWATIDETNQKICLYEDGSYSWE